MSLEYGPALPTLMAEAVDIGLFAASLSLHTSSGPAALVTRAASTTSLATFEILADEFSRPSDRSLASFSSSSEAALVGQAQLLPERVAAAAWGLRTASLVQREDVSLVRVLERLEQVQEAGDDGACGSRQEHEGRAGEPGMVVCEQHGQHEIGGQAPTYGAMQQAHAASMEEALQIVSRVQGGGQLSPMSALSVDVGELLSRVHPVIY